MNKTAKNAKKYKKIYKNIYINPQKLVLLSIYKVNNKFFIRCTVITKLSLYDIFPNIAQERSTLQFSHIQDARTLFLFFQICVSNTVSFLPIGNLACFKCFSGNNNLFCRFLTDFIPGFGRPALK